MVKTLVTGATGNVGAAVVESLRERGVPVAAAVADPARVDGRWDDEVATVRLDFTDPSTFAGALAGVERVFLIRPPQIADVKRCFVPFIQTARASGVRHVVFSSVAGAQHKTWVPHHKIEVALMTSGLGWTILRPGFFSQNIGDHYRRDILEDGRIYLPAGRGRAAFIDARDVGEAAAVVLADPTPHDHQAYWLTGAVAVSFKELAEMLTERLERPIRYQPASIPGYVLHLRRRGLPWGFVVVQTILHVGLRKGEAEPVDPTLARLLGRAPRAVQAYVAEFGQTV